MNTAKTIIDCTQEKPAQTEFEPISTDDIETAEEARQYQDDADTAVHNLLKIREKAAELDNLINEMYKKSCNDYMHRFGMNSLPFDEVLTEHSDILAGANDFLQKMDTALAKFKKFAAECEALGDEFEQQDAYGSYDEQVRDQYYSNLL